MNELKYLELEDLEEEMSLKKEMGAGVITELSRQLRTFFNIKSMVVRVRLLKSPSPILPSEKTDASIEEKRFITQCLNYMKLLNQIPPRHEQLKERLQILMIHALIPKNKEQRELLKKVHEYTESLFRELHLYSEKHHPQNWKVLEQVCKVATLLCEVKVSLNAQLSDYFCELSEHHARLSNEMTEILALGKIPNNPPNIKSRKEERRKVRIRA
jgi:hypothetical protein